MERAGPQVLPQSRREKEQEHIIPRYALPIS